MVAFWENLHHVAHDRPAHTALLGNGVNVSYDLLSHTVNTVAGALRAMGVDQGDRVAVIATKTVTSVAVILGALQLGAVLVPVNPLLKTRQRSYIIRHSGAKVVFCEQSELTELLADDNLPSLKAVVVAQGTVSGIELSEHKGSRAVTLMGWPEFMALTPGTSAKKWPEGINDHLGAILYTSGSTGTAKGVMLSRSNLHYGACSISTYLENTENDRILALMPLSFDYGLSQLTSAIHSGACLVLHDYLFPKAVIDAIGLHKVTGLPAVPHLWDQLMAVQWPKIPTLRYATSTGGTLQQPTIAAIRQRIPDTTLYSMYGFTEAFRATYLAPSHLATKPSSIGLAVPHAQVLVVNRDGQETAPFETGEIIQSGKLVTSGYWDDTEGTRKKFRTRPTGTETELTTIYAWSGDMGYTDNDGYLYFVSRHDDLVKLNGHRMSPAEVEKNLIICEWLDEVCVLCVPDKRFGHIAVAFVVSRVDVTPTDLTQWARRNVPSFMVPAQWYVLTELPASANNKVDRNVLMRQYQNGEYASR